jgi:hypothetical protein
MTPHHKLHTITMINKLHMNLQWNIPNTCISPNRQCTSEPSFMSWLSQSSKSPSCDHLKSWHALHKNNPENTLKIKSLLKLPTHLNPRKVYYPVSLQLIFQKYAVRMIRRCLQLKRYENSIFLVAATNRQGRWFGIRMKKHHIIILPLISMSSCLSGWRVPSWSSV